MKTNKEQSPQRLQDILKDSKKIHWDDTNKTINVQYTDDTKKEWIESSYGNYREVIHE